MNRPWNQLMGWTVVFVVLADWWSKFLILNRVALYERVAVLDPWFYLVHVQNRGVAFSILSDSVAVWRTPVLIAASCFAVVALVRLAHTLADNRVRFAIALVIGGALGNLGDRIANGSVTDFLLVRFFPFIFNIADAAITIGAIVLVLGLVLRPEGQPTSDGA